MNNLELKAEYPNCKALELIKKLPITASEILDQEDIYFKVNKDRLKLRSINNKRHELIWYSRADETKAKNSNYEVYEVTNVDILKNMLTQTLGIKIIVRKKREVYIYNDCRIHIDKVEKLGEYVEFEVIMTAKRTEIEAQELMNFLINHFELATEQFISGSYSDLY